MSRVATYLGQISLGAKAAIGVIIAAKFLIPVALVKWPFIAGWANFVLDTVDGDLLIPLGLEDATYQPIDKIADWVTYVFMVVAAYKGGWHIKKWILGLFLFRSIGQLLFLITSDEILFFYFPNFLEPLFLIYATILFFKKERTKEIFDKWRIPIIICIVLYKMQDEYITHVGNVDRSDLISGWFS